jgi:glycogen phosphorylase
VHATNRVIPRRWSALNSPGLSALFTKHIGDAWSEGLEHELTHFEPLADDAGFQAEWQAVKATNKRTLATEISKHTGVAVDPQSMFDVQLKPMRAHMRQLLNLLYVVTLYTRFARNPGAGPARTVIFGGKAAAGDLTAQLVTAIASVTNHDPMVAGRLNVVLLPEITAKLAQHLCRAADLSEQLSIAPSETGDTENVKFAMNGAITIGSPVAVNLAMSEAVGPENFFLFGRTGSEMEQRRANGYDPRDLYASNPFLREAIDLVRQGFFCRGAYEVFLPLVEPLLTDDEHMVIADYESYVACQERVSHAYRHASGWTRMSILNSVRAGRAVHVNPTPGIDGQHERS